MSGLKRVALLLLALFAIAAFSGVGMAEGEINDLDRPGISVPYCTDQGIAFYWHTHDRGNALPPDGWRLERRHRDEGWRTIFWQLIDDRATVLQTFSERYWDFVDTTADSGVAYTYRVRAIDKSGEFISDRHWSRRAPVTCAKAAA